MNKILLIVFTIIGSTISFFGLIILIFIVLYYPVTAPPLTISPIKGRIDKISVKAVIDYNEPQLLFVINEQDKISKILDFLEEHNSDWVEPQNEPIPSLPYLVFLIKNEKNEIVKYFFFIKN